MEEMEKNRVSWDGVGGGGNAFLPRGAYHSNNGSKFIDVRFL